MSIDVIARGLASSALTDNAPGNLALGVYNANPRFLAQWAAKRDALKVGESVRPRIMCIGTSNTYGRGSGTGSKELTGSKRRAYPARLTTALAAAGIPATDQSTWGMSSYTAQEVEDSDPRLECSGLVAAAGINSLGGYCFRWPNTNTNLMTFAPEIDVDTFVIYYVMSSTQGTFSWEIDSGGTTNQSAAGSNGIGVLTVNPGGSPGTPGSHTLKLARVSGGIVSVIGVYAYDSTEPAVDVLNCGWGNSTAAQWASTANAWEAMAAITTLAPDLTIIGLGAVDLADGTAVSTFSTNLQAIITRAKTVGDVILWREPELDVGVYAAATLPLQDAYDAEIRRLAVANDCPFVSMRERWGSFAEADAVDRMVDGVHPSNRGHYNMALPFVDLLLAA